MFTHLHVHSEYSLLDGLCRIPSLVQRAKGMGMGALGLTDHGALYGAVDFYMEAKAAGIKPIIGCELYVADGSRHSKTPADKSPYHLTVLAKNAIGYKNLIQLTTKAHMEGFYYKPRVDRELLEKHHEGLVVLSGCPTSQVSRLILDGRIDKAEEAIRWHKDVFGDYFLEIQEHPVAEQLAVNKELVPLSSSIGIPLVATNDAHYVDQTDAPIQDILLCVQTNSTVQDENRLKMADDSFFIKSPQDMEKLFGHLPQALESTERIAEMCDITMELDRVRLPAYPTPSGKNADTYLAELCWEGIRHRYPDMTHEVRERLEYELNVIRQTSFANYFLVVWDIVSFAQKQNILCGVRGSAAASIVLYCLGVTTSDPLKYGLVFERFLNLERKELPDVDIDFQDDRRAEVVSYIGQRYGNDRVAQIVTFGTLGAKAAIRDVGRALGMNYGDVDKIARLIPGGYQKTDDNEIRAWTIDEAMRLNPEMATLYKEDTSVGKLVDSARGLEGVVRNVSTHAAGVVISDEPLIDYVPLRRPAKAEENRDDTRDATPMTQLAMEPIARLGLLKMDILGLSNLTILERTTRLLHETRGIEKDLQSIPLDDAKTFDLLSSGETSGVFQLESAGMRRYIKDLKPSSLDDIAAMIALYRPGPMEHIDRYIRAKHGLERARYPHPALEDILADTYGVIVYQEQVMLIAQTFAGYTLGEADILRKAMGKKVAEVMRQERAHFVGGAIQKGFSEVMANEIFELIEKFAMYAFNRAHAVSYAFIAYWTAYFKTNFPTEYMASVLDVYVDKQDKRTLAVAECRRLGIGILPPDINASREGFIIETAAPGSSASIRFGLGAIKNVGMNAVRPLLEHRASNGPFGSIEELSRKVDLRAMGKRVFESLTRVGALDTLGDRGALLNGMDRILAFSEREAKLKDSGQSTMFDLWGGEVSVPLPPLDLEGVELGSTEKLAWEKELLGGYISQHPLTAYARDLAQDGVVFCGQIDSGMAGQKVVVVGMVSSLRESLTKDGRPFAIVQVEDMDGSIEITVWGNTYERTKELWSEGTALKIGGKVRVRDDRVSLNADFVEQLSQGSASEEAIPQPIEAPIEGEVSKLEEKSKSTVVISLTLYETDDERNDIQRLRTLLDIIGEHPGADPVHLAIRGSEDITPLRLPNANAKFCNDLQTKLVSLLGSENVEVRS